jgi:hypothetical protein
MSFAVKAENRAEWVNIQSLTKIGSRKVKDYEIHTLDTETHSTVQFKI